MNGNSRKPHGCPYCWLVYYSRGALTRHENEEHWKEKEEAEKLLAQIQNKEVADVPA